ncbi:uncharacterized protein LOC106666778 isoform X2 [Cimex lectularius]|uniref:THAP-type domain-containing protein n=1 Tax=Cimex lectularius TaxID=79782 RepID=A0A8I6STG4_CIMLE|nr:uncharacterized protein LOC106666778 isoform X2 [Cimex lectularius]
MPGNRDKHDSLYHPTTRSKRKKTKLTREKVGDLMIDCSIKEEGSNVLPNAQKQVCNRVNIIRCIVPACGSNSITCPNMTFIHLPIENNLRKTWLKAIGVSNQLYLPKEINRPQYCCQRHFDLTHDSLNYDKWFSGEEELKLYKGVLPRFNIKLKNEQEILASQDWPCFVPSCSSSVHKCPGKLFIKVPAINEMRARWFEAVGRTDFDSGNYYCCVDHFDMNVDICRKDKTFLIKCDTIPHRNINLKTVVKEIDNYNTTTNNEIKIKMESDYMDLMDEQIMSLKELKDISTSEVVWVSNPTDSNSEDTNLLIDPLNGKDTFNRDVKSKEMYLLSLLPDLKEMSESQIETFKTKIYETIRIVKARK